MANLVNKLLHKSHEKKSQSKIADFVKGASAELERSDKQIGQLFLFASYLTAKNQRARSHVAAGLAFGWLQFIIFNLVINS